MATTSYMANGKEEYSSLLKKWDVIDFSVGLSDVFSSYLRELKQYP